MQAKKITALTSIGAGLEYYDFVIYAMLSPYIAKQFFPAGNFYAGLIGAFCVFAVGYLVRPVGGVIFGVFGDHFGRKQTFLASILLMAFSTLLIGLLPNCHTIGVAATILFTVLRVFQGLSFGAELPGSLTFISEHVGHKTRGLHCGWMVACVGLGVTFGTFVVYVVSALLSAHQMVVWGWRLPFLAGGLLAIVGYFIRKKTTETPYFEKHRNDSGFVLTTLFKNHLKEVICGIGIIVFPACFVIFVLSMPAYLHQLFHYKMRDIYLVMTIGYLWSSGLLPVFGWLSDQVDRRKLLFVPVMLIALFGYGLLAILKAKTFSALLIFVLLCHLVIAVMAASYFVMLAEGFPTRVRFTGVAVCYNLSYGLAALVPLLVEMFCKFSVHPLIWVAVMFTVLGLVTAVSALKMPNCLQAETLP